MFIFGFLMMLVGAFATVVSALQYAAHHQFSVLPMVAIGVAIFALGATLVWYAGHRGSGDM